MSKQIKNNPYDEIIHRNNIFWQYYRESWKKMCTSKAELQTALSQIDEKMKLVKIDSKIEDGNDRIIITATVRDSNKSTYKVYIDIIIGYPSLGHYLEATYGLGWDAHNRILIYSACAYGGIRDDDEIIALLRRNNECGLKTYLVEAKGLGPFIYYEVNENSKVGVSRGPEELPSEERILETQFWCNIYGSDERCCCCQKEMNIFGSMHPRFPSYDFNKQQRLEMEWNEEGFSLYFIDESGSGIVDWLWKNKDTLTNYYVDEYPNRQTFLITEEGKPPAIEFKLIDIPINDLLAMDGRKISYGEEVYYLEFEYDKIIRDAIDRFNYEKSGSKMMSEDETREYLSDKKVLISLFDEIREHLRSELHYYELPEGEYIYWCGRYCSWDGEESYFDNLKSFCRKHNLDWQMTVEALEQMTGESFCCECQMVNRFEGNPDENIEEHWKSPEGQEHSS